VYLVDVLVGVADNEERDVGVQRVAVVDKHGQVEQH
jgi:hypothetical protein